MGASDFRRPGATMKRAAVARYCLVAVLAVIPCYALGENVARHGKAKTAKKPLPTNPPPVRDPDHTFRLWVDNYIDIQQRNIVMQRRDYSCGAACVATVAKYYWGDNVTEDQVLIALDQILTEKEIADRIENGLAMSDLRQASVKLGYQATVGKLSFQKLTESKVPVIVGIEPEGHKHFVVFRGHFDDWVYLADPIRGNIRITTRAFHKQWQKNALLAIAKPGVKVRDTSPLTVRWDEQIRGELNDHLIRTQPQRLPAKPVWR
jgi:predicted double-glycine peptidase